MMSIGIIPGWFLAAFIAIWIGGFPADLCIAGTAIGIALSLAAVARSRNALCGAIAPLMVIAMRYLFLPILNGVSQDQPTRMHVLQWLVSPDALIGISLLSIVASYMLGMIWVHRGEA